MKLTPLDVRKQEFKKAMRGYDAVEVDTFLEMISEQLETLLREKKELSDEVLQLKTQLRDYQNVEKTLQDTLMTAQASVQESKENSDREAEILMKEAEIQAEKTLEGAKLKLAEMKNELVLIKSQKDSFARRLKHLLQSQLELIDVLELDDLGFAQYEAKMPKKGMRRAKKEREGDRESQQLEFQAVEEVISGEADTQAATEKIEIEQPEGINWGRRTATRDQVDDTTKPQSNRISDQLIV